MMDTLQQGILALIHSAVSGQEKPLPEGFDLKAALPTIRKHRIGNMIYYGAINCGIDTNLPIMKELFLETYKYMCVDERQRTQLNKLFAAFRENGIHYLPLKGVLMKQLYPRPDMRIMCDADVLVKMEQYEQIQPLMQQLGYKYIKETQHELVWENANLHVELHKCLVSPYYRDFTAYYEDCWRFGIPSAEHPCHFEMSDEDQFVFLFTHFAKHYRTGGIGLRHIVDLYVYKKNKPSLDEDYVVKELKKLLLDKFYIYICAALSSWFENGAKDDRTKIIAEHIFQSGVYGTSDARFVENTIHNKAQDGESFKQIKRKKWLELVFMPYSSMCIKYPFLKKIPILLPVMWVVRWIDALVRKPQNIKKRREQMELLQEDRLQTFENRMNFVGLTVSFEENV